MCCVGEDGDVDFVHSDLELDGLQGPGVPHARLAVALPLFGCLVAGRSAPATFAIPDLGGGSQLQ